MVGPSSELPGAAISRRMLAERIAPEHGFRDPCPLDEPPGDYHEEGSTAEDDSAGQRAYNRELAAELRRLRIREAARCALRAEQAGTGDRSAPVLLSDLLAEPETPTRFRIAGLLPVGGRVILAAQYKAGKTTLTGNLTRCLADGQPFLGEYEVTPPAGRVGLLDTEMSRGTLRSWLQDQDIADPARVATWSLRGRVATLDLLDPIGLREWAQQLRTLSTDVLILDCLRPVLDAFGLDENTDVGRVLVALDELADRAGIGELIVVHHMGHTGERSRGSSRLRDWPDVEWRLMREDADNPASRRFFSAYGRDVEVPESALHYDLATRHLTLAGTGSRSVAQAHKTIPALLKLLARHPSGLSGRAIERVLIEDGHPRDAIREARALAEADGSTYTESGPKRATLHLLSQVGSARSARDDPHRAPSTEDESRDAISPRTESAGHRRQTPGTTSVRSSARKDHPRTAASECATPPP